jgi:hypothetical protein
LKKKSMKANRKQHGHRISPLWKLESSRLQKNARKAAK